MSTYALHETDANDDSDLQDDEVQNFISEDMTNCFFRNILP
jgi:hypothetical protein